MAVHDETTATESIESDETEEQQSKQSDSSSVTDDVSDDGGVSAATGDTTQETAEIKNDEIDASPSQDYEEPTASSHIADEQGPAESLPDVFDEADIEVADAAEESSSADAGAEESGDVENEETEPDLTPGDYVIVDPIPDRLDKPWPDALEIIEPHQPPFLGNDPSESAEPVVVDVAAAAAAAVEERTNEPAAPKLGDRVVSTPGLERIEYHGKPIVASDETQDVSESGSANLNVMSDRLVPGGREDITSRIDDATHLSPFVQKRSEDLEPLVLEVEPADAVAPDSEGGAPPSGYQSVDTYLAAEDAKEKAAGEDAGGDEGSIRLEAAQRFPANEADVSRLDAARIAQSGSTEDTEIHEDTDEKQNVLLTETGRVVQPGSFVLENAKLADVDAVTTSINTSALDDIGKLVAEQVGASAHLNSDQLTALIGGITIQPSANSMVSEGGAGLPVGGTYSETVKEGSTSTVKVFEVVDIGGSQGTVVSKMTGSAQVWHDYLGVPGATETVLKDGADNVTAVVVQGTVGGLEITNVTTINGLDGSTISTVVSTDALGIKTTVTTTRDKEGNVTNQTTEDNDGKKTDTTTQAQEEDSNNQSSQDDDDDDDDDDSNDPPETAEATPETTDEGPAEEESDPGPEGTPNPMNDEPAGPPLVFVTEGRLGRDQMSAIEKGVNVASGGGHTDPAAAADAQAPLEFLVSEVGQSQFKADQQAIESARGGGVTDPTNADEENSEMPNLLDFERVGFMLGGGGLIDPPEASGGTGVDGGVVAGGGTPTLDDDDDPDDDDDDLSGNMASQMMAEMQMEDQMRADIMKNLFMTSLDTSNVNTDLADRIKNSDFDDIS
jgi:hypothetical protein